LIKKVLFTIFFISLKTSKHNILRTCSQQHSVYILLFISFVYPQNICLALIGDSVKFPSLSRERCYFLRLSRRQSKLRTQVGDTFENHPFAAAAAAKKTWSLRTHAASLSVGFLFRLISCVCCLLGPCRRILATLQPLRDQNQHWQVPTNFK